MRCSQCGSRIEKIGGPQLNRVDSFVHFKPWQRIYINKNYTDRIDLGAVIHNPEKASEYGLAYGYLKES